MLLDERRAGDVLRGDGGRIRWEGEMEGRVVVFEAITLSKLVSSSTTPVAVAGRSRDCCDVMP